MAHTSPMACLSLPLLRYVRDQRPTEQALLAWLGPAEAGRYHTLRKAGLLHEQQGYIMLSPDHSTSDGRGFRFREQLFLLDEDRILTFKSGDERP